tara:strand:+ start:745 stop:1257 length:513 start_codon:yes stop_codon:yes gene_type:complete
MNIFFFTLIIFFIIYLTLNWFVRVSSKKITKLVRTITIFLSIVLAIIMLYAGRIIFSLPFLLMIVPLIKTKAGLSLIQLFRIWGLLRVLKNSGRFSFGNTYDNKKSSSSISIDEAYKILNLNPKLNPTKEEVVKSYKKIMAKIHPDISPQTARLAQICTEAKDEILKKIG